QKRVFAMIPGLEHAEFQRFGSVHRNTFVNSPVALDDSFQLRNAPGVYLAGQVSGVEGYVESAACGLAIGAMLALRLHGRATPPPPTTTALGTLLGHLRKPDKNFQPTNVIWGMFPSLPPDPTYDRDKGKKRAIMVERALRDLESWRAGMKLSDDERCMSTTAVSGLA
ncbi:MAG TPA: FAD-dependent oxidoreductase, partial [Polyangiales bacterium]